MLRSTCPLSPPAFLHYFFLIAPFHIPVFLSASILIGSPSKKPTPRLKPFPIDEVPSQHVMLKMSLLLAVCVLWPYFPPSPLSESSRSKLLRTGITQILRLQSTWSLAEPWQRFSWGSPRWQPTSLHPKASFGMSFEPRFWQRDWGFSPPLSFRLLIWEFICFQYHKTRDPFLTHNLRLGLCLSSPNTSIKETNQRIMTKGCILIFWSWSTPPLLCPKDGRAHIKNAKKKKRHKIKKCRGIRTIALVLLFRHKMKPVNGGVSWTKPKCHRALLQYWGQDQLHGAEGRP